MNSMHYLLKGFQLLFHKGVRRYVIIPLMINLLFFIALIAWGSSEFSHWVHWLDAKLPSWLQWLDWLFWLIFLLAAIVFVSYTFALLANLIGAPFNGFLSAKIQKIITGVSPESHISLAKEIFRAIKRQIEFMLYYALWVVVAAMLFFIPVINVIATPVWLIMSAWVMGMQYLDYPMDNNGIDFKGMRHQMAKQRWDSLSFGATVMLVTLIPIVNFFVMPAAVIGGTLLYLERFKSKAGAN